MRLRLSIVHVMLCTEETPNSEHTISPISCYPYSDVLGKNKKSSMRIMRTLISFILNQNLYLSIFQFVTWQSILVYYWEVSTTSFALCKDTYWHVAIWVFSQDPWQWNSSGQLLSNTVQKTPFTISWCCWSDLLTKPCCLPSWCRINVISCPLVHCSYYMPSR